jgi:hypothetical protein
MSGQLVSWRDYEGVDGFAGQTSADELHQLRKALVAGQDRDPVGAAPGVGFPLRVESLEQTLKNTTFRMEHIRFWRMIPKAPAFNTVEEYNQVQSYGQSDLGAFIDEGALPEETDAQYERKFSFVKFMGTTRRLTHVMSLVKPAHGNVIAQETIAGTMRLLEQIERALYEADSRLDPVQWTGLQQMIEEGAAAANIIDLRGRPLTEDNLTDGGLTIMDAPNFGIPTHLLLNPKNKADLVKTLFPRARFDQFQKTDEGMIGADIRGITTPAGDIQFVPDTFIDSGGGIAGLGAIGDAGKRPASPTITTPAVAAANPASLFSADDVGTYFWWVVAVNKFGQSAPVLVNAVALAVASGDAVTFGVTPGAGPTPSYYKVYRTAKNVLSATALRIDRVRNDVGAAEKTITDLNANLPGTFKAFMVQMNQDNMAFKQLAPMLKIPLATIDTSIRWMQLIYGTPVLYTPRHNVLYKNIGRAADFVGAL